MLYFRTSIRHSAFECTLGSDNVCDVEQIYLQIYWNRTVFSNSCGIFKINQNKCKFHQPLLNKMHCMQMHCKSKEHKSDILLWNKAALSCPDMPLAFCHQTRNDFSQVSKEQSSVRVNSMFNLTGTQLWLWGMEYSSFHMLQYWASNTQFAKHWKNMFPQIASGLKHELWKLDMT